MGYDHRQGRSLKILVTGGAGFIGSHVTDAYLAAGHSVVVVDNLSTGSRSNLPQAARFFQIDLCDVTALADLFDRERPEVVNHLAAQIDVRASVENPVADARVNIIAALDLLRLCHRHRVKKVIFSSTGGTIYGEQESYPADEGHSTQPRSPYGIAKLAVENYLQFYHWTYGMPFVALRYANVYGPRQNPHGEAGVVAIFIRKLLDSKTPVINGDGSQTRDYVFVDDVVYCNMRALDQEVCGVFNVGTGVETDLNTVTRLLLKLTGADIQPIYGPAKAGEQKRSCLKPGKLQRLPFIPLEVGLERTVQR